MRLTTALMAAAALAAGAGLAACQRAKPQVAALPLEMGAAAPLGEAPAPGGLPPAPPARIATLSDHSDVYAYPDRAWDMSWAFGDSPPDYAFYDEGVTPWVWVADDDSECLAEPVPGGERYYYFEPGAYTPFYVQDPSYGYGFQNGQLVAIYARGGRELAPSADPAAAATAGQYLARGRLLRQASSSQPHQPVAAANWNARRGLIAAEHASFARDAARDPGWLAYHDQHQAQAEARFASEAMRRERWAAQSDTRLGQSGRAQREQHQAQSLARGGMQMGGMQMGGVQMGGVQVGGAGARGSETSGVPTGGPRNGAPRDHPGVALNRYAAAPPPAGPERRGRPERPPHQTYTAAPRPQSVRAERPQAMARTAAEHANDAAFQARAEAHVQARAPAQSEAHAGFAARPAEHTPPPAAAPPHPAPQAPAAPAAKNDGGHGGAGGGETGGKRR